MTHRRPTPTARPRALAGLIAVAAWVAAAGCGDDPFAVRWAEDPDTTTLFSLAHPNLNLPSAFDFHNRIRYRVESPIATGRWDVAVDTRDGQIVLLPPGALGVDSRAAIAPLPGMSLADVTEAPRDTASYVRFDAVPVQLGTTYAIRTHQVPGFFGTRCVYYAKLEPLAVDPVAGTLEFVFDESPACNNPSLVPPD